MHPPLETGLENPIPTINWQNSSPNYAHQKESLVNGWLKYPSGYWGRKFHYGCHSTPPPAKPLLVRPHASFYLLTYMIGYYLLGCFSSLMERFAYLGHLGHLAMIAVPIGSAIAGLNLEALAHQIGGLFPLKWVSDSPLVGTKTIASYPKTLPTYSKFCEEHSHDTPSSQICCVFLGSIFVTSVVDLARLVV
ncbi:hypothetical protein DSO57_1034867 [Entomophthora muscae]|uniref:Uncharacterized protein n=1 Tax=Entomophthora muscae TaxID=34485 RepID=A0ACC2U924_9FUNG|nr:hypothetical protein DSO57_1034867 [Entomophthora muscae]